MGDNHKIEYRVREQINENQYSSIKQKKINGNTQTSVYHFIVTLI